MHFALTNLTLQNVIQTNVDQWCVMKQRDVFLFTKYIWVSL